MAKTQNSQKSQPRKNGRPEAKINADQLEMLAAADLNVSQIAMALGIGMATLYRAFEKYPELRRRFEIGRDNGNQMLLRKAWRVALDGDSGMLRFLIKNRVPGYQDMLVHGGKINHEHKLVGPMSVEETEQRLSTLRDQIKAKGLLTNGEAQTIEGRCAAEDDRSGLAGSVQSGGDDLARKPLQPTRVGHQRKYIRQFNAKKQQKRNARSS